jgi:methylated-DNA-protein-cysteine methyltransferase-like protein
MTYGQVALALGMPRAARVVGGALHLLGAESDVPWHRVVNRHGGISTRCPERSMWQQAERLRAEGVAVDDALTLDLARYRWSPDRSLLADLQLAPEVLHAVDTLLARAEPADDTRPARPPRALRPRARRGGSSPA